jgi:ABC-type sulfate/molybdate transport systems ATPase subunit
MRFIFKTDYAQDIQLVKHTGQAFWYGLLMLVLLVAPWWAGDYWLSQLSFVLIYAVAGLPYGKRKVVELARALCTGPKLLLLDEPSSGLNVEETEDMAWWIQDIKNELGITVLMVEHDMSLVSRVSDRVLAMNQGEKLALGTPAEVQSHPGVIEAYLGSVDDVSSLRRKAA